MRLLVHTRLYWESVIMQTFNADISWQSKRCIVLTSVKGDVVYNNSWSGMGFNVLDNQGRKKYYLYVYLLQLQSLIEGGIEFLAFLMSSTSPLNSPEANKHGIRWISFSVIQLGHVKRCFSYLLFVIRASTGTLPIWFFAARWFFMKTVKSGHLRDIEFVF